MFKKEIYIERISIPEENLKIKNLQKELEILRKSDSPYYKDKLFKFQQKIEYSKKEKYDYNYIWSLEDYFQIIRENEIKIIFLEIKFPSLDKKRIFNISSYYKNNLPAIWIEDSKYSLIYNEEIYLFSNFQEYSKKLSELIKKIRESNIIISENKDKYFTVRNLYKQNRYLFEVTLKQIASLQKTLSQSIEKTCNSLEKLKMEFQDLSLEKEFKTNLFEHHEQEQKSSNYTSPILSYLDSYTKDLLMKESYYFIYETLLSSVKRWGFCNGVKEENDLQHTTQMIQLAFDLSKTTLSKIIDFPSLYKMVIFHDSWEIITGDIPNSSIKKSSNVKNLECKLAIKDILRQFKNWELKKDLIKLYLRAEHLHPPLFMTNS